MTVRRGAHTGCGKRGSSAVFVMGSSAPMHVAKAIMRLMNQLGGAATTSKVTNPSG